MLTLVRSFLSLVLVILLVSRCKSDEESWVKSIPDNSPGRTELPQSQVLESEDLSSYGLVYCDGIYGSLDVYTIKNPSLPGTYLITIIPVSVTNLGAKVSIVVADSSNFALKLVASEAVLNVEEEILGHGYLTESELSNHDRIVFYQPDLQLTEQDGSSVQSCYLAKPGEMPQ